MPGHLVADADVGDQVDQETLAVFPEVLRVYLHADGIGDGDRPVLGDLVLDVHGTHCGEGKVEAAHQ
jgi:hypothetical protein